MAITKELLAEVLEELAESPWNILVYTGTKGYRSGALSCPVSQYLRQTFPAASVARVGTITATVGDVSVYLPEAVAKFVRHFDNGRYPELDSERGSK